MKKPASQSKANYLVDYKLKPGADGTEVTSDGAESLEGSEGSVQFRPWSPQKYAEIQGSEED
jgi:hypothetical protein